MTRSVKTRTAKKLTPSKTTRTIRLYAQDDALFERLCVDTDRLPGYWLRKFCHEGLKRELARKKATKHEAHS